VTFFYFGPRVYVRPSYCSATTYAFLGHKCLEPLALIALECGVAKALDADKLNLLWSLFYDEHVRWPKCRGQPRVLWSCHDQSLVCCGKRVCHKTKIKLKFSNVVQNKMLFESAVKLWKTILQTFLCVSRN